MRFFLPVFVCVCIYLFSATEGSVSSMQSDFFVEILQKISFFRAVSPEILCIFVRKFAHWFEYALLGGTSCFALKKVSSKKYESMAFLFSVLFAIFDEVHQLFVSGRAGRVEDVLIDSLGVLVGIAFSHIISKET